MTASSGISTAAKSLNRGELPPLNPGKFKSISDIIRSATIILEPPEELTVSQAAARYRRLNNAGAYVGPWYNNAVRYMVEPMDTLESVDFDAVAFCGPAQAAKTDALILNWLTHGILCNPMDKTIYSPTMAAARDFANRRIDRLHRHTPAVGDALRISRDSDNKFDKHYKSGMMLTLSYPSPTEFAGKPIPHVAITDYDRIEDDIDGDGNAFDLASKRTTTFGSYKMTLVESSPSKPLLDPKWIAATPHEAPPATGIFAIYNRGDRRRWYWPCPQCGHYFEGEFDMLEWDTLTDDRASAATVRMICPKCGQKIHPNDRHEMNLWGHWLREGQYFDDRGVVCGEPRKASIASFWLRGVAASFVTWMKLVENYIVAQREYEATGDDGALKKFYNNDMAEVYIPRRDNEVLLPETLQNRAEELDTKCVPPDVRFLVATVDVQKNKFVVQVHGILPGAPHDVVVVDRFDIIKSQRVDEDGERLWVKPASYLEDWDELLTQVMDATYPLADGSGRRMAVKMTLCDSGGYARRNRGTAGVVTTTDKAYDFYRRLRRENLHGRFHLVKGDGYPNAPTTRISYPDAQQKDKLTAARGDVPVLMINTNLVKDNLSGRLECVTPGKGLIRFPKWLPDWFYQELTSEVRTTKGWENPSHSRNEATDLLCYCIAGCLSKLLSVRSIDWDTPPNWAAPWDDNSMISQANAPKRFDREVKPEYDFAKLGASLG